MKAKPSQQLGLPLDCPTWPTPTRRMANLGGPYRSLRGRLPEDTYFGSCGWAYPEWARLVWGGWRSQRELQLQGLREYAAHPLLRTLLVEATDRRSLSASWLSQLAVQLPDGMRCGVQVPWEVTAPRYTREHFGGLVGHELIGKSNPHFFDPTYFRREVFDACKRGLGKHLGLVVLTFPALLGSVGLDALAFARRLEQFLEALAAFDVPFAIELREPQFLSLSYARVLAKFAASHVFTSWDGMPTLAEQARWVPSGPELVVRMDAAALAPRTRRFCEPALYDRLHAPEIDLRRQVVELLAQHTGGPAYVFVSNMAEGSAPLSIIALAEALAETTARIPVGKR